MTSWAFPIDHQFVTEEKLESTTSEVSQVVDKGRLEDRALMQKFLQGDDHAFRGLFRKHNQRIYVFCRKFIGNPEAAEDLSQEVWRRIIELRSRPQEPILNPAAFLLRVARNVALDYIKTKKENISLDNLEERYHPVNDEQSEMESIVQEALNRLSPDHREVLILHLYNGYRLDEIAEMLNKSKDAIWARASRARKELRTKVLEAMNSAGRRSAQ